MIRFAIITVFMSTLSFSASAGVIRSTLTATEYGSWTENPSSGSPTSGANPPSNSTISVAIYQKRDKVTKIEVSETKVSSSGSTVETVNITPLGSSYIESSSYVSRDTMGAVDYTSTATASGSASIKVTLPRKRDKGRKGRSKGRNSSGGKVAITLTQTPSTNTSSDSFSQSTNTSQTTRMIQANLSKRPTLTYLARYLYNSAEVYTAGGSQSYSSNYVVSGQGKASGQLTP